MHTHTGIICMVTPEISKQSRTDLMVGAGATAQFFPLPCSPGCNIFLSLSYFLRWHLTESLKSLCSSKNLSFWNFQCSHRDANVLQPMCRFNCNEMRSEKSRGYYEKWIESSFTKWNMLTLTEFDKVLSLNSFF